MKIFEEHKAWNADVEEKRVAPPPWGCPGCHGGSDAWRHYEDRDRTFLTIVEKLVVRLKSWVVRFRCCFCGKRITVLPPFGVRFSNYVKPTVLRLCEEYEEESSSYQDLVEDLGYDSGTEGIDERRPSKSLVWRWLRSLGEMDEVRRRASRLIHEADAGSRLHRRFDPIPENKYRSDARRKLLTVARGLIRAEREHVRLFAESCLPRSRTA